MDVSRAKRTRELGHFFSRKNVETALRLLGSKGLDLAVGDAGIAVAKLSDWWDTFIVAGQVTLRAW